jgi:hypothetical protein
MLITPLDVFFDPLIIVEVTHLQIHNIVVLIDFRIVGWLNGRFSVVMLSRS